MEGRSSDEIGGIGVMEEYMSNIRFRCQFVQNDREWTIPGYTDCVETGALETFEKQETNDN